MSNEIAPTGKNRFCPACGAEVDIATRFCTRCGEKIVFADNVESVPVPQNRTESAPVMLNESQNASKPAVKYAEHGDRFLAFIIDSIIISAVISFFAALTSLATTGTFDLETMRGPEWIFSIIYFWIGDFKGQTLGKLIMKIRVVDDTTLGAITPLQALLHVVGKVFFAPIDVILTWFIIKEPEEKKKIARITQRISKTVVIKV